MIYIYIEREIFIDTYAYIFRTGRIGDKYNVYIWCLCWKTVTCTKSHSNVGARGVETEC